MAARVNVSVRYVGIFDVCRQCLPHRKISRNECRLLYAANRVGWGWELVGMRV